MTDYVKGKVVIITGGSSGFGLEAARILLERGAKVAITGRNADRLNAAAQDLKGGDNLLAVQADARSTDDWKRLLQQTAATFGRIDVLVNNHGAGIKIAPTEEMDDASIQEALDVNIASVIRGCRETIPYMKKRGSGLIINVSSACAYHSWPTWGVYTAAKAGMVAFTRSLHLEMAEWGGRATNFIPGAARTNFCQAANLDDSWLEGFPSAHDFARTIVQCIDVPDNCFIEEVSIWGVKQTINPF
ncbi:MAG: putative oxidoreductase [Planctomycetes bacterium ADurb.Bin126]|nr:MAG: putative oxidoreductase [Planctomycetes bacterium ADurb.Bin126]HOD82504.1 SDR family oxidoreductase [Phycisphaerae bacterium]HQL74462.1 SDR family oxidoreductase [Phycisphaerae bacterium]